MKNINIGVANLIISNKLKDLYLNDKQINESKTDTLDFFNVVKDSPILQLEFKVYDNIESKWINNDMFAKEYIDNNVKLFEVYTNKELDAAHDKLVPFITEHIEISEDKLSLYGAINTLINESLRVSDKVNVDAVHESFTTVFNHVKTPKKHMIDEMVVEILSENVIEIAVDKFNEKYSTLNEDDKNLLNTLISSSEAKKEELLESYKKETLLLLEGIDESNKRDNMDKAMLKIKEMVYNQKTVDDNIISLHGFKKELL